MHPELEEKLKKAKSLIDQAKKPLVFYDDDLDGGPCAVLLKRYKKKCFIYPVIATKELAVEHLDIVRDQKPDLVIIVDKPLMNKEFYDGVKVPLIWIDHHPPVESWNALYINPLLYDSKDNRPTSYWVYNIVDGPLWLAALSNVADWHITDIVKKYARENPNMLPEAKEMTEIWASTPLGKAVQIVAFSMRGGPVDIRETMNWLLEVEDVEDILEPRTHAAQLIFEKYDKRRKEFDPLLQKAEAAATDDKFLIFIYEAGTSFTSELSNRLLLTQPKKVIIIGRLADGIIKASVRSSQNDVEIRDALVKALEGRNGRGGGHPHACGLVIQENEFDLWLTEFRKEIEQ